MMKTLAPPLSRTSIIMTTSFAASFTLLPLVMILGSLAHVSSVEGFTTLTNSHLPKTPSPRTAREWSLIAPPLNFAHARPLPQRRADEESGAASSRTKHEFSKTSTTLSAAAADASDQPIVPPKPKKVRIQAFDSMRFFLIACIVLGHFIRFAQPSDFVFKFFSQHNVLVGAFMALSGYVMAYTSTEIGERRASPKLLETPSQQWTLSRVFGFYPLHLFVLLLFSPLFVYVDLYYNGWTTAAKNALLSVTLTQAWFPSQAEVWNAPSWFLSALTFATALLPFTLPQVARMKKKQLRRTAGWLSFFHVLPKLDYAWHNTGAAALAEGWTSPKVHPNYAMYNLQRFNPLMLAAEVLLGAVCCRLVMLDSSSSSDEQQEEAPQTTALSTIVPLGGIVAMMALRASGIWNVSDMLVRPLIFVPLFLRFLMAAHRNTVNNVPDPTNDFLSNGLLVWLGNLAFPIYLVHGPIGQIFFKKLIAKKLFGRVLMGPTNFGIYALTTFVAAVVLQKTFLQNKEVIAWSKRTVEKLSAWM